MAEVLLFHPYLFWVKEQKCTLSEGFKYISHYKNQMF